MRWVDGLALDVHMPRDVHNTNMPQHTTPLTGLALDVHLLRSFLRDVHMPIVVNSGHSIYQLSTLNFLPLLVCCVPILYCSSLVHSFKHAFRPTVRHMAGSSSMPSAGPATPTTHITLHLSQLLAGAAEPMEVDEPVPCAWPPVGTHLGHLPSHLVSHFCCC